MVIWSLIGHIRLDHNLKNSPSGVIFLRHCWRGPRLLEPLPKGSFGALFSFTVSEKVRCRVSEIPAWPTVGKLLYILRIARLYMGPKKKVGSNSLFFGRNTLNTIGSIHVYNEIDMTVLGATRARD